jgi:hypothetical protein
VSEPDLVPWLRRKVGADLKHWRDLEAAYLPGAPKEGEWLWAGAREHADQAEARLALLDLHTPVATGSWTECGECGPNNQGSTLIAVPGDGDDFFYFPCRTVRLLGSAYRRQAGYREAWKP